MVTLLTTTFKQNHLSMQPFTTKLVYIERTKVNYILKTYNYEENFICISHNATSYCGLLE